MSGSDDGKGVRAGGQGAVAAGGSGMRHIAALDGFRGLAVLLVMWSHFVKVSPDIGGVEAPWARWMLSGHHGVDMFFVLSGFLITGILLDSRGRAGYFKVFFMRRVLRIFPLYYFVLAVVFLGTWMVDRAALDPARGVDSPWWFWLYASNWGMVVKGWGNPDGAWLVTPEWASLGHFWSLAVEEQFYLVWPWVVAALGRRPLIWVCLSFLVLAPVMQSLLSDWAGNALSGYVSTVGRLNTLGAGALLAMVVRSPRWLPLAQRLAARTFVASALALGVVLGWRWNFALWKYDLLSLLVPLCCASGLLHALQPAGNRWRTLLSSPAMVWFGTYSYGLYVYHHLCKPLWIDLFWDGWITPLAGTGLAATTLYIATAGLASTALAVLSWKCLESPCLKLKRHFSHPPANPTKPPGSAT